MPARRRSPSLLAALAALALALPSPAPAAETPFATTNLQLLQGWGFRDSLLGYDTVGSGMATLTLNHFSAWGWGDNFFFVDLYRGDFRNGWDANLYAEWHPRVFLDRLLGSKGGGVVRHAGLAFELNVGPGFYAYLAGAGGDLALPFGSIGVNLYFRYANVQIPGEPDLVDQTWQLSPFWSFPLRIGKVPILFTGFVDVYGTSDGSLDVLAEPELLVDVLAPFGGSKNVLYVGVEWYLHYDEAIVPDALVSAPQAMLQWNLH